MSRPCRRRSAASSPRWATASSARWRAPPNSRPASRPRFRRSSAPTPTTSARSARSSPRWPISANRSWPAVRACATRSPTPTAALPATSTPPANRLTERLDRSRPAARGRARLDVRRHRGLDGPHRLDRRRAHRRGGRADRRVDRRASARMLAARLVETGRLAADDIMARVGGVDGRVKVGGRDPAGRRRTSEATISSRGSTRPRPRSSTRSAAHGDRVAAQGSPTHPSEARGRGRRLRRRLVGRIAEEQRPGDRSHPKTWSRSRRAPGGEFDAVTEAIEARSEDVIGRIAAAFARSDELVEAIRSNGDNVTARLADTAGEGRGCSRFSRESERDRSKRDCGEARAATRSKRSQGAPATASSRHSLRRNHGDPEEARAASARRNENRIAAQCPPQAERGRRIDAIAETRATESRGAVGSEATATVSNGAWRRTGTKSSVAILADRGADAESRRSQPWHCGRRRARRRDERRRPATVGHAERRHGLTFRRPARRRSRRSPATATASPRASSTPPPVLRKRSRPRATCSFDRVASTERGRPQGAAQGTMPILVGATRRERCVDVRRP